MYTRELCGKMSGTLKSYCEHYGLHRNIANYPFPCCVDNCSRRFISYSGFKSHTLRGHGSTNKPGACCTATRSSNRKRILICQNISCGVPWPSGLVHRICVLMAESSECEFESWLRPWCLCPWARHLTIIASLHPGENGYLWGQSWLLCLISPICAVMAAIELYTPQGAEMVSGMIYEPNDQG